MQEVSQIRLCRNEIADNILALLTAGSLYSLNIIRFILLSNLQVKSTTELFAQVDERRAGSVLQHDD